MATSVEGGDVESLSLDATASRTLTKDHFCAVIGIIGGEDVIEFIAIMLRTMVENSNIF